MDVQTKQNIIRQNCRFHSIHSVTALIQNVQQQTKEYCFDSKIQNIQYIQLIPHSLPTLTMWSQVWITVSGEIILIIFYTFWHRQRGIAKKAAVFNIFQFQVTAMKQSINMYQCFFCISNTLIIAHTLKLFIFLKYQVQFCLWLH